MPKKASPQNSTSNAAKRGPTVPIPSTVEKVKGYGTLTIYKMDKSPFYYVRIYDNKKVSRCSTKMEERRDAIGFAKEWFVSQKTTRINKLPINKKSGFEVCAYGLMKENQARQLRGELSERKLHSDRCRLEGDLLPFFKKYEIQEIDYRLINDYVARLNEVPAQRKLATNSLKIHMTHIKTILKYAQRMGVIQTLPLFPSFKTMDTVRAWLSKADYSKLHNTARTHVGEKFELKDTKGNVYRTMHLTQELYELILFMVNTFIRPTDIRVLRHSHIKLMKQESVYLLLSHPSTKGHAAPIVSMPQAIDVYQTIVERQKANGTYDPNGLVFMPEHAENRDYALQQLGNQFNYLLTITDLKETPAGELRTLYSLRHTAIMFRLIESNGLDLLTLARAARTSVEMIDRFYAKHLTAEMNVGLIQSHRSPTKQAKNDAIKTRLKNVPIATVAEGQNSEDETF
jgi:hypothetical protein